MQAFFIRSSKGDLLYSLMADTAAMTTVQFNSTWPASTSLDSTQLAPCKSFSGGAYIALQNKNWPEPRKYIMARMRSSLGDLSCYVTVQRHYLQNVKWRQKVMGQESLPTAILANL